MDQRLESLPDCKGNVNVHNQTKIDFFTLEHLRHTLLCPLGAKKSFLTEMVQRGPDGPKTVPNGHKL